jgi:hypothetical protein
MCKEGRIAMSKTRVLNGTVTMALVTLLLLSTLGVLFLSTTSVAMASPGLTVTPSSGKVKTTFKVTGTGFGDTKKVGIGFGAEDAVTGDSVTITPVSGTNYTGTLSRKPIEPTSVTIKVIDTESAEHTLADTAGDGKLKEDGVVRGVINYATGVFWVDVGCELTLSATADYTTYKYDVTPSPVPTTNSTGYFEALCEVPFVKTGTYTVTAINEVGYKETASFTVVRGITLIPSKGPAGALVKVYGSGFTPGGTRIVDIYFDKNGNGIYEAGELWIADQDTDADGRFQTAETATPPVTAGYGDYRVYATDGVYGALAYYTVCAPQISISPEKGTAGTVISISINYFNKTSGAGDVQVFFDTNNNGVPDTGDIIILVYQTELNATGGKSGLSITVSEGVGYGDYGVIARNDIGEKASKTFTVMKPTISIVNPAGKKGVAGMGITVQVNYFNKTAGAGTTFVFFDANKNNKYDTGETRVDLSLNNTGGAEATLTVPTVAYGTYPVNATNNIHSAVDYFTVERPVIVISKYPVGVPGTPVKVDINYFSLGADVKIGYDVNKNGILETGEVVTTVSAGDLNSTGGKAGIEVIAKDALGYGPYTINATNPSQWAATTFTVMHPTIKLSRDKGTAGTPLTVDINYFNKTSGAGDVKIGFDVNKNGKLDSSEVLATVLRSSLNDTGGANEILINVPESIGFGVYKVNATNDVQSVTATFTVMQPVIAITPDKGTAGTLISIWVNYYNKTTAETYVFFDANKNGKWDYPEPKVALTLNETGGAFVTLTVPAGVGYGAYKVYGNNTLGQALYATFTVMEPVMNIGPTRGAAGTTVTVEINYFNKTTGAGAPYTFFDSNGNGIWDLGEPKAIFKLEDLNNTGGGVIALDVPTVDPGTYKIYTKNNVQSAYKVFEVTSIEISLLETIKAEVEKIEAKLDNSDFGLGAIKTAIDTLATRIEEIAGTIMQAVSNIDAKLGSFHTGDTVASLLYEIKASIQNMNVTVDLTPILNELRNETYGLAAIKSAVSDLSEQLSSAVESITSNLSDINTTVTYIKNKLDAITAPQVTSGGGSTTFTSSGTSVIYEGAKVGTVTVSLKTTGVGYGERLRIRYYTDPNNPTVYIEKTVVSGTNTLGWTDTAAAWKVEIAYTWSSGTDTVYWSYSAIHP